MFTGLAIRGAQMRTGKRKLPVVTIECRVNNDRSLSMFRYFQSKASASMLRFPCQINIYRFTNLQVRLRMKYDRCACNYYIVGSGRYRIWNAKKVSFQSIVIGTRRTHTGAWTSIREKCFFMAGRFRHSIPVRSMNTDVSKNCYPLFVRYPPCQWQRTRKMIIDRMKSYCRE